MINLLPDDNKIEINKEYRLRRFVLVVFFCFVTVIIAAIFLLPSFIISIYKVRGVNTQVASVRDSKATNQELQRQLDDIKLLTQVLKPEPYTLPSSVIELLMKDKIAGVSLTNITYSRISSKTSLITVKGLAQTRQTLGAFTEALGHETSIEKVDVPVSNFAKDSNINFTFTITTKDK